MEQPSRPSRPLARRARDVAIVLVVTLLLFALVEGSASTLLLLHDLSSPTLSVAAGPPATVHDPELGWVFAPGLDRPDFFGPGIGLRTDARSLRGDREIAPRVPTGRVRVLCSGDSFTFGWGVADADPWCAQLEALDPRIEAVNLGVAGYGLGQIHLRYRREGSRLEHDAHVVALIAEDFRRMAREDFEGVPKPRLQVVDGRLVVPREPVPPPGTMRTTRARFAPAIRELRLLRLVRGLRARLAPDAAGSPSDAPETPGSSPPTASELGLADGILASTAELSRAHAAPLLVVYLPVLGDLSGVPSPWAEAWRSWLEEAASRHGFRFLDLTPRFGRLTVEEKNEAFIPLDRTGMRKGRGHYTRSGHAIVARAVHEALTSTAGLTAPAHDG